MRKAIALGLAAVTLAGCGQLFGGGSPQRKAGLWEQSFQGDMSATPVVTKACYDAASDRRNPVLPRKPRRAGFCDKFDVSQSGGGWVVDSTCGMPGGGPKISRHSVISGDFSSKYTMVTTLDIEGLPDAARNGQHKSTVTATYLGACPPDIQPGQVQLPNGDIVDMASLRQGGGRGFGGGGGGGPQGGNSAPSTNAASNAAAPAAP